MKPFILIISALLTLSTSARAQFSGDTDSTGELHYGLAASAIATSGNRVPFWMSSNQYGSVPLSGISASLSGFVKRDYNTAKSNPWIDWGGAVDARFNAGSKAQLILVEAYLKAKLSIFQLKAGRSRDVMGIASSELSSGNFAISGNALGIPKAEISVPDYWSLPLTRGVIALKGNFALGYVGMVPTEKNFYMPGVDAETYFHQKSLYGRLGKAGWRVKLYGGFNHQVFWGDENLYFNEWNLSPFKTAVKAVTGSVYKGSKVGNHLGSIDQGMEITFKKVVVKAYHEFFYDVGGLYHLNNIKDGLWGITFDNSVARGEQRFGWSQLLIEFVNTKSQGGEPDAKITPSGDENYYNGMYMEGWTYKKRNLGSPLLTNRNDMRTELPHGLYKDYIVNNRVTAIHIGLCGFIDRWSFVVKATYSANFGTYGSSPWGHSNLTIRNPQPPPYFSRVNQLSAYAEASRSLKKGYRIGFILAGDKGGLLYNSIGGMIRLSKTW